MNVTFVGGWATDPVQYPKISDTARFLIPFSGFQPEELSGRIEQGGDILIGWSTGAHILLKECLHLFPKFEQVVLVAPFLSFIDSFPERLVRRMIAGLKEDPAQVVTSFHTNCGEELKVPFDKSQTKDLIEGLEYLISSSIELESDVEIDNLILLHGNQDKIVRRKAFKRVAQYIKGARTINLDYGHKIPEKELLLILK